jgi:hypothetical protein
MALDNLASELDALRSNWETTNKAYRLSDRFDFERTPTSERGEFNDLSEWRQRMNLDDDDDDDDERDVRRPAELHDPQATPTSATAPTSSTSGTIAAAAATPLPMSPPPTGAGGAPMI